MYGIKEWTMYQHIKSDPTFPYVNVGVKKRLLIEVEKLERWIQERTYKMTHKTHLLPSLPDLLEVR